MIQARTPDGKRFNFGRDILQLFPRIGQLASNLLVIQGFHPAVRKWAEDAGLTQPMLLKAAIALAEYTNLARTTGMTKEAAWVKSGLSDLHPAAMLMLFFFVGTATADTYLNASLAAMPVGETPWGAERLAEMAERFGFAASTESERKKAERLADAAKASDKLQSPDVFDS